MDQIHLDQTVSPILFYAALALGAVGLCLALPRGGRTPQVLGALVAAIAGGLALLALGLRAGPGNLPNVYFYIFGFIALAAAVRVITHPKPVYAALYFILTVLSSAGLFLILSAEFMAFALIIVYAGAILITYLFVIMLATQAPTEEQTEVLASYDTSSREPMVATVVGFALLGVLTLLLFTGTPTLTPMGVVRTDALLAQMPRKVESVLHNAHVITPGESLAQRGDQPAIDLAAGIITVSDKSGQSRAIPRSQWPPELTVNNVEGLGFNLLRDHPGSIEIAGVILLMAMLGAVVLSRKQVQIDEDAKLRHAQRLAQDAGSGA